MFSKVLIIFRFQDPGSLSACSLTQTMCIFINGSLSNLPNLWPCSKTSLLGILLQALHLLPWMRTLMPHCSAAEHTPSATLQLRRESLSQSYQHRPRFLCTDNSLLLQSCCRTGNTSLPASHDQHMAAFNSCLVSTCGFIRYTD